MSKLHALYMLDETGNPLPVDPGDPRNLLDWGQWRRKHHRECVVAQDSIRDDRGVLQYGISTVFTGTNAGLDPPLLWETAVMSAEAEGYSPHASYATRLEAEVGHQRALAYFCRQVAQTATKVGGS